MSDRPSLEMVAARLEEFESKGGVVHIRHAAQPSAIDEIEVMLGIRFPESLKELYRVYEWVSFGGEEFLGPGELHDHYVVVCRLLGGAKYLVPFIADGTGGYFGVVCEADEGDSPPEFGCVLYINGHQPAELELESSNLFEFLLERIEVFEDDL